MPLKAIDEEYRAFPFEMRMLLSHQNGHLTQYHFNYVFKDQKPDIQINYGTKPYYDKKAWKISASSEEQTGEGAENGRAIHLIDLNGHTFWYSNWTAERPSFPHEVIIDFSKSEQLHGLGFKQRPNKSNGRLKKFMSS